MIITKLIGGLGNQMFQYAAGRRLAYVNDTELKLDITGYKNQIGITPREYMLHIFNIQENFSTENEIENLKKYGKFWKIIKQNSYYPEKHFHFDPSMLSINNNSYIQGYWASEKYFKDIASIIHSEFTFKKNPDKQNKEIIDQIQRTNSISIHIRRGDYVSDAKTNKHHGVCDMRYYRKAVATIVKKIKSPHFFVFSDDPKWVKDNLHIKFPCQYIDHNVSQKDYEDMRLMTECKHNIIANSTFSWWGAWLNKNEQKIVITPHEWFEDKTTNTKDLIPHSWNRI